MPFARRLRAWDCKRGEDMRTVRGRSVPIGTANAERSELGIQTLNGNALPSVDSHA